MLTAVSPFLAGYPLVLSALLAFLHTRRLGAVATGLGTLLLCVFVAMVPLAATPITITRQALQFWTLFVLVPSAVVWAISCLDVFVPRPWMLMIVGPLSFVFSLLVVVVTYNITANR
jgi:hypothetical protein